VMLELADSANLAKALGRLRMATASLRQEIAA